MSSCVPSLSTQSRQQLLHAVLPSSLPSPSHGSGSFLLALLRAPGTGVFYGARSLLCYPCSFLWGAPISSARRPFPCRAARLRAPLRRAPCAVVSIPRYSSSLLPCAQLLAPSCLLPLGAASRGASSSLLAPPRSFLCSPLAAVPAPWSLLAVRRCSMAELVLRASLGPARISSSAARSVAMAAEHPQLVCSSPLSPSAPLRLVSSPCAAVSQRATFCSVPFAAPLHLSRCSCSDSVLRAAAFHLSARSRTARRTFPRRPQLSQILERYDN